MKNNVIRWIVIILPVLAVAGLGTLFVNLGMDWFNSLTKPAEWIPNFVIPVVWTIIYISFIIILLLWSKYEKIPQSIITLLIANGILNVLWCLIFFTLSQLFIGNVFIVFNLVAGFWLILEIKKFKPTYASILLIYPIWLCLATTLNNALWILN